MIAKPAEKFGCVHFNPVTRGLVSDPIHWPWGD
jgi:hypothetical protein